LFLIASTTYGQSVYNILLRVERVPINHSSPKTFEVKEVLIVMDNRQLGIFTGQDTLILVQERKHSPTVIVYSDIRDGQRYYIVNNRVKSGFSLFIAPLPPYKRPKLWGISLMSI